MYHPRHVKLHLDYNEGPMASDDSVMGGEGPWGIPVLEKPFHYKIDNLLFGTIDVGLFDIVRCKDIGTDWADREVVELVEGYPCWRGLTRTPEDVEEFITELRKKFTQEQVQVEGGMGIMLFQCEPDVAMDFMEFLDTTNIGEYALEPVNIDDS